MSSFIDIIENLTPLRYCANSSGLCMQVGVKASAESEISDPEYSACD